MSQSIWYHNNMKYIREAFQSKTWELVQSGDDPPPLEGLGLFWTWDFFELGTFLKWVDPPPKINLGLGTFWKRNDPLKIFRNKLNMKNIGTKSVNMSDIMVYLAMFSTTIDNILCFLVLIIWKWVIILLVFGTLWNLGLFGSGMTP